MTYINDLSAMILAAGRGERMRPLTDKLPKPLLKVGGRHLIEHHLIALRQAGVRHVVINTAWLGDLIEAALGDGQRFDLEIEYSHEGQGMALETGGGIFRAMPKFRSERFIVVNGDVWCDFNYDFEDSEALAHLLLVNNPSHNPDGDFCLKQNRLVADCAEKLTFSGIGLYHQDLFKDCSAAAFPLAPLLRQAIAADLVTAQHYTGNWIDVGTPERLKQVDDSLLERV